jgi:signal transduction histidine kinase
VISSRLDLSLLAAYCYPTLFSRDVQPVMSIKPLPGDVVAQIKSSVAITSLNSVICGLVKNALDAEATKINLAVDYSRGNCSIEDNGVGIPPLEFKDTGGLGQLHCMSTMMSEICRFSFFKLKLLME